MPRPFRSVFRASGALVALLWLSPTLPAGAAAQSAAGDVRPLMSEIVVTAELRRTDLFDQASSTSVLTPSVIARRAATHLEEVLGAAPNVNFAGGTSRARYFQIRGIGERSQFVEPLNPSVGLIVDGVDFSGLGTAAALFDTEQIEILRGPQGTLYGANALAGLINVHSGAPQPDFDAYLEAGVADYESRRLQAMVTGPVAGSGLRYRLALQQVRSDGFIRNRYLGRDDTNDRDETALRARLAWEDRGGGAWDLMATHLHMDNGYDAFSLDNTRETLSDRPGRDAQKSRALRLRHDREYARFRLEALASVAGSDSEYRYDEDWSYPGIAPGLEYASEDSYRRERDSASAQLRLVSAEPLALPLASADWVAGLYFLEDDESLERRYTYLAEDYRSRHRFRTLAAFGEVELALGEAWSLGAGLRVADRSMQFSDSNAVTAEPDQTLWGGALTLRYLGLEGHLFYLRAARGYRANGVNAGVLSAPERGDAPAFFDEELLFNYELGHKYETPGGRFSSRLALFYMDRRDQQVRGSLVLPRADGSTAFLDFTDNAAEGRNLGLEWEARLRAGENLDTFLALGLLRTRFDDYDAAGLDLEGRDQAHAPRYQFSIGGDWRFSPGWLIRLEAEGKDEFYFSDRHGERSRDYVLLHARLSRQLGPWQFALWGRNLTDEDVFVRGFGSFGNDPRKLYAVEPYYQYGEPSRVGVTARYDW